MNKIFTEFENENSLRTYPFASGCTTKDTNGDKIGTGILIDAAIYPVNSSGLLYLSSISSSGVVSISDSKQVVMTAVMEQGSNKLEFYDTTDMSRHVGTVLASSPEALSVLVHTYETRTFRAGETTFSSACVFPVVNDGVTSMDIGGTGGTDGQIEFSNSATDTIRVSTNGSTLRFDVIPEPSIFIESSIQHIYCIVDGKTPFRIIKMPFLDGADSSGSSSSADTVGNTIAVYLDNIDKQDICSNAHREDAYVMTDTCEECASDSSCHDDPEPTVDIPSTYQVEVVDVPNGADSSFYLAVPNFTGYDNPLSITLTDGVISPKLELDIDTYGDNTSELTDTLTAKGIVIQVPGMTQST